MTDLICYMTLGQNKWGAADGASRGGPDAWRIDASLRKLGSIPVRKAS